jgi:hypothetical protein
MEPAPIMPNPPALETAEASRQPLHQTIPACMMGYRMLNSVVILFCIFKIFVLHALNWKLRRYQ